MHIWLSRHCKTCWLRPNIILRHIHAAEHGQRKYLAITAFPEKDIPGWAAVSRSSSSSKIRLIPPESSRNFLCNSRISPNAKKLWDTTDAKNRKACASSPAHIQTNYEEKKSVLSMKQRLDQIVKSPWVEIKALSPLCSIAYNKLRPHVTLWGSCLVIKSSRIPNSHLFFKSNSEWCRSSWNLDSTICLIFQHVSRMIEYIGYFDTRHGKQFTCINVWCLMHLSTSLKVDHTYCRSCIP